MLFQDLGPQVATPQFPNLGPRFASQPESLAVANALIQKYPSLGEHEWFDFEGTRAENFALNPQKLEEAIEFFRRILSTDIGKYLVHNRHVRTLRNMFHGEYTVGDEGDLAKAVHQSMDVNPCYCGDGCVIGAALALKIATFDEVHVCQISRVQFMPLPAESPQLRDIEWILPKSSVNAFASRNLTCKTFCELQSIPMDAGTPSAVVPKLVPLHDADESFLIVDSACIILPHCNHSCATKPDISSIDVVRLKKFMSTVSVEFFKKTTEAGCSSGIPPKDLLSLCLPRAATCEKCDVRRSLEFNGSVSAHNVIEMFFDEPWFSSNLQLVLLASRGVLKETRYGDVTLEASSAFPFAVLHDTGGVAPGKVYLHEEQLGREASQFLKAAFEKSRIYQHYCHQLSKPVATQIVEVPCLPPCVIRALQAPVLGSILSHQQLPRAPALDPEVVANAPLKKAISRESRLLAGCQAAPSVVSSGHASDYCAEPEMRGVVDFDFPDIEWVTSHVSSAEYHQRKLGVEQMPCQYFREHEMPSTIPLSSGYHRPRFLVPDTARIICPHAGFSQIEAPLERHVIVFESNDAPVHQIEFAIPNEYSQDHDDSERVSMSKLLSLCMPGRPGFIQQHDARANAAFDIAVSPHRVVSAFFKDHSFHPSLQLALKVSVGVLEGDDSGRTQPILCVEDDVVVAILHVSSLDMVASLFANTEQPQALEFFRNAFQKSNAFQQYSQKLGMVPKIRLAQSLEEECLAVLSAAESVQMQESASGKDSQHGTESEFGAKVQPELAKSVTDELWTSYIESRLSGVSGSATASGFPERRFLILTFSRNPCKFDTVLLNSDVAREAIERGAEIKPEWGHGAKVFVEGLVQEDFDIELTSSHVVVREEDRDRILDALRQLPYDSRPRLKPGQCLRVHDPATLLRVVSDEGDHEIVNDAGVQPVTFKVHNTFIHVSEQASSSSSAAVARSWGPP